MQHIDVYLADAYSDSAYGACAYSSSTTCSTASGPGTSSTLANTGIAVTGIVTVACLLLLLGVVVRFWRRPVKSKRRVPTDSNDTNTPDD